MFSLRLLQTSMTFARMPIGWQLCFLALLRTPRTNFTILLSITRTGFFFFFFCHQMSFFSSIVFWIRSVVFFATFRGTHTGEKGPVKATKKEVESHYVYVIRFDAQKDEIISMTKIWNDNFAFKQWGWAK